MPKPEYTAGEIAANTWTVGRAMLRGGRLTAREQRRLERIRDKAETRGNTPLSER
ncbi:hypothetical protein [Streptomyces sp. NBC_00356]|uniref:hypothetical protein n=1 Tax=Streptomyces sp. NBC_00356 TaxID=2975724 RepID=UPI002E27187A